MNQNEHEQLIGRRVTLARDLRYGYADDPRWDGHGLYALAGWAGVVVDTDESGLYVEVKAEDAIGDLERCRPSSSVLQNLEESGRVTLLWQPEDVQPQAHRYYFRYRPPAIGTHPAENETAREVWQPWQNIPGTTIPALGWVEYSQPLDARQVESFELLAADNLPLPIGTPVKTHPGKLRKHVGQLRGLIAAAASTGSGGYRYSVVIAKEDWDKVFNRPLDQTTDSAHVYHDEVTPIGRAPADVNGLFASVYDTGRIDWHALGVAAS